MIIVSDVHGKWSVLHEVFAKYPDQTIVQIGDLGIGFGDNPSSFPNNFYFIHGNHDNYDECKEYPNFLGRYGTKILDGLDIFFVSGAYSIDKSFRTVGKDWWESEQLTMREGNDCYDLYSQVKPSIVISHDFPGVFAKYLIPPRFELIKTLTGELLNQMFEVHQPLWWTGGHHHVNFQVVINSTVFECLADGTYKEK